MRVCDERRKQEALGERPAGAASEPFYNVPEIFLDDWMNDYYSAETEDDFRFVYIGERGTMTQLHVDVYKSYSWSTNITGKKLWRLYNPESPEVLTVEQSAGELIFVPSGWKHEVLNLSPLVISINHNWCNAINLFSVYEALAHDIEDVEKSIDDVKHLLMTKSEKERVGDTNERSKGEIGSGWYSEWIEVVQELTKQHSGWNWKTFWEMVAFITRRVFDSSTSSSFQDRRGPVAPPLDLVKAQIKSCVDKFKLRDEFKHQLKSFGMIEEIEVLLCAPSR